jgi:NADH-quinone oxidoreductase subunit L
VLHALHHKADVWEMGGLYKKMPITTWTFVIGGLAIAGIPPFAGFWSKDEILVAALNGGHYVLFAMAAFTAFLTAFYMWRMIFLAFFGEENPANHPHESPWTMTLPLVVLSVGAIGAGWLGTPWYNIWGEWIKFGHPHHGPVNYGAMLLSIVLAAAGIYLAYMLYLKDAKKKRARKMAEWFGPVYRMLYNKYYIDELYLWFNHALVDGTARLFYLFDIYVVDGIVNGIGAFARLSGDGLRVFQSGRIQNYVLIFFLGVLAVAVLMAFTGPSAASLVLGGVK